MTTMTLNRRHFIGSVAAVGGGFAIGWAIQEDALKAFAQEVVGDAGREVGIWVVIHPDDVTTVRIARSEMGQGTLTGLCQLVAEELECDWNKLKAEYVKPEENLAQKRAWGDMSFGGRRGLRTSVDYVRKGGAAARMMLVQAAATQWGVPAGECVAENSVITHKPSGKKLRFGEVV